jgi:hypothetical protein
MHRIEKQFRKIEYERRRCLHCSTRTEMAEFRPKTL